MSSDNKYCIKNSLSLGVIMTINQAIALSGCNKTESNMTITHLTKGLQMGVLGGDKPNKKTPIDAGILAGLCAGAVISVFFLTNCRPVNAGVYTLQGNDISLQGNDFLPPHYANEINAKLLLAKFKDNGYDGVLSKNNSGRANRSYLAFHVTDSDMDSQIHTNQSDTSHERFKRQWGSTPLFMVAAGCAPTPYEGKTSLNKIAERRISGAAAICAESEPRHPIPIPYSVTPTQKQIGGIHA